MKGHYVLEKLLEAIAYSYADFAADKGGQKVRDQRPAHD
jgi:hypothetical protein